MTQRQQYAIVSRDWLEALAAQKPEKPDYWSSCGQCERASDNAQDFLAAPPPPEQVLSEEDLQSIFLEWANGDAYDSFDDLIRLAERAVLQNLGAKNGE